MTSPNEQAFSVSEAYTQIRAAVNAAPTTASPSRTSLSSFKTYSPHLPTQGIGNTSTLTHILQDITPGLNGPKLSSNYYGFVTGGVLPIAEVADNIVTAWDQNVQVHLPDFSVSTVVEAKALDWLEELLDLDGGEKKWEGRTFTTGATAANILGLATGRESIISRRLERKGFDVTANGLSTLGLLGACRKAGIDGIQVVTTMGHSSLYKAASVVGIGRGCVVDVGDAQEPWKFDIRKLEGALKEEGMASIVAISCGEVNTGRFATNCFEDVKAIRDLCDKYGAWLHVDGAFGIFARALPRTPEFASLITSTRGLELADSITGDSHKALNVPYDSGFFYTRHLTPLTSVFSNGAAAYLQSSSSSNGGDGIPSPLNIGLENSRRWRALPVYSVLLSLGHSGFSEIFARQIRLARSIASFIYAHPAYDLLPLSTAKETEEEKGKGFEEEDKEKIGIIVLFRARDEERNQVLVERINEGGIMYVSGTQWEGRKAVRIAVCTWMVDVERDLDIVKGVLGGLLLDL